MRSFVIQTFEGDQVVLPAHQVGYIFGVEQRVQEFCSQIDGRLGYWNSGGFRDGQGGRLLFIIVIFHQGWLCIKRF